MVVVILGFIVLDILITNKQVEESHINANTQTYSKTLDVSIRLLDLQRFKKIMNGVIRILNIY